MKKILSVMLMLAAVTAFSQGGNPLNRNRAGGITRPRGGAAANPAADPAATPAEPVTDFSALNWDATPVDTVLMAYGDAVGKTVLKDPAVPNVNITLKSRLGQKLTKEEYVEAVTVILEMNGVHLEEYGTSFIRAIPRGNVRKDGAPIITDPNYEFKESGRVISAMIKFENISYEEAQKALEGFKSATGILLVFERINSILATDTEMNVKRMLEIAKAIDVASQVDQEVFMEQVENASAQDIKAALEAIVQESQKALEKAGKGVANVQQQNQAAARPATPFRRPGAPQPAPRQPENLESIVTSVSGEDRCLIRGDALILADDRSNRLVILTSKHNMEIFRKVIKMLDVSTTPDTVVKVRRLKYADAEDVSDMINDLIGNAPSGKDSKGNQNANAKAAAGGNRAGTTAAARKSVNQRTGDTKTGELNKDNTTVLADKRINGLVVMTQKDLLPTVEQIIDRMDIKLSQVLIETVIIEVSLGDDFKTGIDWVQRGRQRVKTQVQAKDAAGRPLYYAEDNGNIIGQGVLGQVVKSADGLSEVSIGDDATPVMKTVTKLVRDGFYNNGHYMLGGGGGSNGGKLGSLLSTAAAAVVEGGEEAAEAAATSAVVTPIGGGLNYIFKSDKLNLGAIIEASKSDSRSKYLASPVVMTVDNKEATVNATRMKYLLRGFQSSGNSYSTIAVPDYEQKELGIEIKVTPKINPNGTVMLEVEEKYTQLGENQEIKYATGNSSQGGGALESVMVPTTVTREMSADVLLEDRQTVVFGGLTETSKSESETGIPILKDIPWIGKWLFGSVTETESRNELLVFMTPYVLDDAEAAQLEAIRRKKTMSDARPWEDGGWSASELADPVSRKELMRRMKEEWAKQDEERKTKLALEKLKVDRMKALKELSEEEYKVWLKMHKEELDKESKAELERTMQDPESQERVRELLEQFKEKKLEEAEKAIREAEKLSQAQNARSQLDAEAAKKAAEKSAEAEKTAEDAAAKPEEVAKPAAEAEKPVEEAEKPAEKVD